MVINERFGVTLRLAKKGGDESAQKATERGRDS